MVVVEGPWDVLALAQIGVAAAVAVLGVQLSTAQARSLALAAEVVVMFDGDNAGRVGARRRAGGAAG